MSRFKRTTDRGKWTAEDMDNAITAVIGGMTYREAAERYSVPRSTLNENVMAKRNGQNVNLKAKLGRFDTIFTEKQEQELKRYVLDMEANKMPLNKNEFQQLAFDFATKLDICNPFNPETGKAGESFYQGFLKFWRKPLSY